VVETVGTQEYAFSSAAFAERLGEATAPRPADEVRPHLPG
jgi:hypothetical protein